MQDVVKGGACFFSTPPYLVSSAGGIYSLFFGRISPCSPLQLSAVRCAKKKKKDVNRDQAKAQP